MVKDRYSQREQENEDRQDRSHNEKVSYYSDVLKSNLGDKEKEIIDSIIINSQDEYGNFVYDLRQKALKNFQETDLLEHTKDFSIDHSVLSEVKGNYVFYIKRRILLEFPEYKIPEMLSFYKQFLEKKDQIKEIGIKKQLIEDENISDIDLFNIWIAGNNSWKPGIKNLLSLIKEVQIKQEKEIMEEIVQERIKEALNSPSPKEKLLNFLGKETMSEYKSILKEEWESGNIFPGMDLINYCIEKINKKYNLRFTEDEKNILLEIGQNYLKKVKSYKK